MDLLVLEILPAAIGIAVSPLPIMIVVLLLVAGNSRSAIWYVAGWLIGIVVVGVSLVLLSDATVSQEDPEQSLAVAWGSILLGVVFLMMAFLAWRGNRAHSRKEHAKELTVATLRGARDLDTSEEIAEPVVAPLAAASFLEIEDEVKLPAWMRAIDKVTPLLAVALAVVSAFNPKNLSMIVLAVADINRAEVSPLRGSFVYLAFAALATVSVAVPLFYWLYDRERADARLKMWQHWLAVHQQQIMMWLFFVLGMLAVLKGIQKLF